MLYGPKGLVAIEVKSSAKVRRSDYLGLEEFSKDYPVARCFLLYGGSKRYKNGKIDVIPVETFLREIARHVW